MELSMTMAPRRRATIVRPTAWVRKKTDVGRVDPVPGRLGHRPGRLADVGAGVVDEDVDPAVALGEVVGQRLAGGDVRHVERARVRLASRAGDRGAGAVQRRRVPGGDDHRGPRRAEGEGNRLADAPAAAGDQDDAAAEVERHVRAAGTLARPGR
jgi:hypothetical protein